jgi:Rad3-related DNA helicase/REP element-mobilizing transposase RayT
MHAADPQASVADLLAPGGRVAKRLGDAYEPRPQQIDMARAVERAFVTGDHLVAEAGTGVGKSFAYLLPAIDAAVRRKKRVVISTHTIALQEQIVEKDVPLLRAAYGDEFSAVLVKGRGNYLCLRRLDNASRRAGHLFASEREKEALFAVEQWASDTTDGDLGSLPVVPDGRVWEQVRAEAGNCMGKRCRFYKACHWQAAKRRMQTANLLVVNHALFFSDLALRLAGVQYLPKYDHVIFDEAHTLEDVAAQHFGLRVGEGGVRQALRGLFDAKRTKGFLTSLAHAGADLGKVNELIERTVSAQARCEQFFDRCLQWRDRFAKGNGRVRQADVVEDDLSPLLLDVGKGLTSLAADFDADKDDGVLERKLETASRGDKLRVLGESVRAIIGQTMPDAVYWIDATGRTPRRASLHASPVDVGEGLKLALWSKTPGCVLTSATLGTSAGPSRKASFQLATHFDEAALHETRRRLPHWTQEGATYAVTFRLADSLPAERLEELKNELAATPPEKQSRRKRERIEGWLDQGIGQCLLKRPEAARAVASALAWSQREGRCNIAAWCVMPNHVHVVLRSRDDLPLSDLLHKIKSYSAKEINRLLDRTGQLWQHESYDHLIRDEEDLENQVEYILQNPLSAGFIDWPWVGRGAPGSELSSYDADGKLEACPTSDPFAFLRRRLGLDASASAEQFGSPFDYQKQAKLHVEIGLPEPADPRFADMAAGRMLHWIDHTAGGAFVLFTSYKALIDAANRLKQPLEERGLPLFVQGQDAPRKILLERFRQAGDGVLLGTASFWQGVDVRGTALRNVIIHKLPFAVPDEPVVQARLERIAATGGNGFMDYSVPEAVIKLRQGFGRLIRSQADRGIVVLLDGRVISRRYGKAFLDSLPDVPIVEHDHRRDDGDQAG